MRYKIAYLPEARSDTRQIRRYLDQYYQSTVMNFFDLLKESIGNLKTNPLMYERYERRPDYRRMVVGDYLVFYKVLEDKHRVEIHRILHSSRQIERYID